MSNQIHPTVIIEGDVELGVGNKILPYTTLTGPLRIGDDNIIGPHVVVGSPGQDTRNPRYDCSDKRVEIGNHNIIREFTAIQKPAYQDVTRVGDHVFIMQSVHIPHDAWLEDHVVITPMVVLAGITRILQGATMAIGSTVHQYGVVGQYSIVAMGAAATHNVLPFSKYIPGKPARVNTYALKKHGMLAHLEEIRAYVEDDVAPTTPRIKAIVDHFEAMHRASGRTLHR